MGGGGSRISPGCFQRVRDTFKYDLPCTNERNYQKHTKFSIGLFASDLTENYHNAMLYNGLLMTVCI